MSINYFSSNYRLRFPRTYSEATHDASYANPIQRYRKPPHKRLFFFLARNGWALVLLFVFVFAGSGCTDDLVVASAVAADLKDAQQAALVAMRGE